MEPGHLGEPGANPGSITLSSSDHGDLRAAILVGGSSTRMGQPKAPLKLGEGDRLLDRVHQALAEVGLRVTLVGEGPITAGTAELERIPDASGVPGPLGGILGALEHDPNVSWLVVACDLALIRSEAIRWLLGQRGATHTAILPRITTHRIEPLFALYEPTAQELLRAISRTGSPAPKRLERQPGVVTPEPPPDLRACWSNINTPDQVTALGSHGV
jgi:molybdopterin-guanine dinucleotide biosynthesis protein A